MNRCGWRCWVRVGVFKVKGGVERIWVLKGGGNGKLGKGEV